MPVITIFLKIIFRGNAADSPHRSSIWADMPSEPVALLGFSLQNNGMISFIDIGIWWILLSVLYVRGGNTLLVSIGVHCLQKNVVNNFTFSLQSTMNLLSIISGGTLGALDLFITLFKTFQYIFPLVCWLCNLFPKLTK